MINRQRWHLFTLAQQLGNIGSEIARARSCQEKSDLKNRDLSLERTLDLLDATIDDPRWTKRLREFCRFREVVADWYSGQRAYEVNPKDLEDYCIQPTLIREIEQK